MRFKRKIRPDWDNIHFVQERLKKKLRKYDKSYIDNITMVTGELLENSVKYYNLKNIKKPLEFYFSNDDGVEISVRNQWIEEEDLINLSNIIDEIKKSSSPYELYVKRLQEILENRVKGESKLGLLRVVSEGKYILDYKREIGTFCITASQKPVRGVKKMKKLDYEGLNIEVIDHETYTDILWSGKSRALNPEYILDNYLDEIIVFLGNRKAVMSFEELESMNSSTIPPILTFIRKLEEKSIESVILYNDEEDWQNASFKPLSLITADYRNVVIKSLSEYNNL